MTDDIRVLLVEDNPGDARLLQEMLQEIGSTRYDLIHLQRLEKAAVWLREERPDVVLLDLLLPDSHGLDTFRRMHACAPGVPILVLSGHDDEALAAQAVREGAQDYLVKGQMNSPLLARAMRYAIERKRREREMEVFTTVATALRAARSRADMLPVILNQALSLLKAEGAALAMRDPISGEMVIALARGAWDHWTGLRLPEGVGISGAVIATGQLYRAANVRDDPHLARPDLIGDLICVACVPLITQEQGLGALWVGRKVANDAAPRLISDGELRLLAAIADIAANALHRAGVMETLEQRVAERTRELAEANEQLKELDRLKTKFISDVSHELRTPITNLNLYLNLMEQGKPEKRAYYLSTLRQQAGRLAGLVEDILDLSRLEQDNARAVFSPVDLNQVVGQAVAAHQARAEAAGLRLAFEPGDDLPVVRGEPGRLTRLVSNLLGNAINYTPQGSVHAATQRLDGHVCLQVRDTGIGIEPEDIPHLFERFYRGRRASQSNIPGTGLGLGIAKEIVDLHGGKIEVSSRVGQGSTFTVWLPQDRGEGCETT
jgi:signal transduction histidine kinase